MIQIGIADDHAIVRTGLRQFLLEQEGLAVAGEAGDGRATLDLVRAHPEMQVLLLDISMPGSGGVDVLGQIRAHRPDLAVLVLSGFPAEHYALALIKQGAAGYLSKECDPTEIAQAIRVVAGGRRYVTPEVGELLAQQFDRPDDAPPHEQLSERELQVFLRLARGETVGQIAEALSLSAKTVSTYRSRVLEKLALATNSDLTYYALKVGLIR